MVSHLLIGRDPCPLSLLCDEDPVHSADTFAFRGLGSFVSHDPDSWYGFSAVMGGAFALLAGSGPAVDGSSPRRTYAASAPPASLGADGGSLQQCDSLHLFRLG